jgi:hypothetical protein
VQRMPVMLLITAIMLWGGAIGADADDAGGKIWAPLAVAAAALTVAGLQQMTALRLARTYEALTQAVLNRPFYRGDTGPQIPVIRQQPAPGEPHGRLSALGKRHGQHASR